MKEEKIDTLEETPKKNNILLIIFIVLAMLCALVAIYFFVIKKDKTSANNVNETNTNISLPESKYHMTGNGIQDFDLVFMQLENNSKNKVYSPLSIKYALEMLSEGAKGDSKAQIDAVIGEYVAKKYTNSANMSFANGLFIRDSFKSLINKDYINVLNSKYNADVVYDSFKNASSVNKWVSDKTLKLIDELLDDDTVSRLDYILINALAIDMEWVNKIQSEHNDYSQSYAHENFGVYVSSLDSSDYHSLDFNDALMKAKSVKIAAAANKYDIINDIGEDKIRETVGKEYDKWLSEGGCGGDPDTKTYLDSYIKELNSNYGKYSSSTDFKFYESDSVKAFAKDLKTYNGLTLQYIGIMPKETKLTDYIKNANANSINEVINNLKTVQLDSFKEGYVTKIEGYIPMFKYNYEIDLKSKLSLIGIKDVFDSTKADLTGITPNGSYIDTALHSANIDFSNDGIKAAAATAVGGKGSANCKFVYNYDVPVITIDLTFEKPYMYIIRDNNSGEVWFAGTVYEPTVYKSYYEEYGY